MIITMIMMMMMMNLIKLDVFPALAIIINIQSFHHRNHHHHPNNHNHHHQAVVKVDDSGPGIIAGLNAGCWTVGIAKTVR